MKKIIILATMAIMVAVEVVVLSACTKSDNDMGGEMTELIVTAGIPSQATKAVADYDGNAAKVDHWVLEVHDVNINKVISCEERDTEAGTHQQTFKVYLVKNHSYNLLFWADTKGSYATEDLTNVSANADTANLDCMDAFSACLKHKSAGSSQLTATLTRPFAQLNVVTTDLETIWEATGGSTDRTAYDSSEPTDFCVKAMMPANFNVETQKCGTDTVEVAFKAMNCYTGYRSDSVSAQEHNNYYLHLNPATLFMGYVFAPEDEPAVLDLAFSFKDGSEATDYTFTNIPLQRNYRTNISGKLLSNETEIEVTINRSWTGIMENE